MAEIDPVPVFLRVGDVGEYEVGSFTPEVTVDGATATLRVNPALAVFLRALADHIEAIQ